jgi:curved DNA-binding protein CbpA
VLGVEPNATLVEIKKAFRSKAQTAHPDVGGKPEDWYELNDALRQGSNAATIRDGAR